MHSKGLTWRSLRQLPGGVHKAEVLRALPAPGTEPFDSDQVQESRTGFPLAARWASGLLVFLRLSLKRALFVILGLPAPYPNVQCLLEYRGI